MITSFARNDRRLDCVAPPTTMPHQSSTASYRYLHVSQYASTIRKPTTQRKQEMQNYDAACELRCATCDFVLRVSSPRTSGFERLQTPIVWFAKPRVHSSCHPGSLAAMETIHTITITIMSGCVGCSVRMYVQESSNMNGLLGSVAMASTEIFRRSGLVTSRAQGLRCDDGFNLLVAWAFL
jgi:hypothetical protein